MAPPSRGDEGSRFFETGEEVWVLWKSVVGYRGDIVHGMADRPRMRPSKWSPGPIN